MNTEHLEIMLKRFEEATAAGRTDDEAFRAIAAILRDHAAFPLSATLVGVPVIVEGIDYLGPRLGITATVVRRNRRYRASMLELEFPLELAISACLVAYRRWAGGQLAGAHEAYTREPTSATEGRMAAEDLVVFGVGRRHASCRFVRDQKDASIRLSSYELGQIIPGEILTIAVRKTWEYGAQLHVSGSMLSHRLDVQRLGLVPLGLRYQGEWEPQEFFERELAGIAERDIPDYYLPILAAGVRPEYEMDQVIPGYNPTDDDDPIVVAADRMEGGDGAGARELLMSLLAEDLRCVDAYAHLGNMDIDSDPGKALRYYQTGMAIAELSFPTGFSGLLLWGHMDNRPFLRCLHGLGLCHWRLGQLEEAEEAFERMLWLSPIDNQGARMLIEDIRAGRPWRRD